MSQVAARKPARTFDRSIIDGPIGPAVWKIAWPTMLQNVIAGLQGVIDQAMVGNFVGAQGNAALGDSWQIILVVVVFLSSMFTGMGVLVARFAGANESDRVNRVVYQAFIAAFSLSILLAAIGYFAAPTLLDIINAAPEVQHEALPFLRTMFMGIFGMMMFFMLSGAFRAAGDAHTPLRLGLSMTVLTICFNVILIPKLGTIGAAFGTIASSTTVSLYGMWRMTRPSSVIHFERGMDKSIDFTIIRSLFKFGLPTGVQGIAMNVGGVLMLRFVGSLEQSVAAQAAYTVCYTQLFSLITWTSNGLLGASATIAGQNLGAGIPERANQGVRVASRIGLAVAAIVGLAFVTMPHLLLAIFGMKDPEVLALAQQLLFYLSISGLFITVALSYTGGLQGTGDTRSPLYISVISQVIVPLGLCTIFQATRGLQPADIWMAIVVGHITRCTLSWLRFRQGKWRDIRVDVGTARS
ncbi:MAG TPA: MATE family efflux transporter [Vicinamibacterales bacterium]|nr:MATE family efflux transporter [Vicinamibacterales bacterium]